MACILWDRRGLGVWFLLGAKRMILSNMLRLESFALLMSSFVYYYFSIMRILSPMLFVILSLLVNKISSLIIKKKKKTLTFEVLYMYSTFGNKCSILVAVHKPSHQSACQASVVKDSLPIGKEAHAWSLFIAKSY